MAATAEKVAELETNLLNLRKELNAYAADIETTRRRSMELIEEKTMETQRASELANAKVHELYEIANSTIGVLAGRVQDLENASNRDDRQFGHPDSQKSLVPAKQMVPSKLSKVEEWKRWRIDLEDYAEASMRHLKEALRAVKSEEGEYDEAWFEGHGIPPKMASMKKDIWRMLKAYTDPSSDGRRVVEGVADDDGWLAWKRLHEHYEPSLMVREGQVLAELAIMANKTAKNPAETKRFLLDLEDKIRKVNEVVGRTPDDMHCKSIVLGFIDTETNRHCGINVGANITYHELKTRVLQYTNAVGAKSSSSSDKMDVSAVQNKEDVYFEDDWGWEEGEEDWCAPTEDGTIMAVGKGKGKGAPTCFNCGLPGHYARECPKGKSKGKGKAIGSTYGSMKGKGKAVYTTYGSKGNKGGKGKGKSGGKGPATGCWDCGGSHYRGAPECPAAYQARSLEPSKEVKSLCTLTHQDKKETYPPLPTVYASRVNSTGTRTGKRGVRENRFKVLESESDDEETLAVDTALDARRFEETSEWTVVKAKSKNVLKHIKQDEKEAAICIQKIITPATQSAVPMPLHAHRVDKHLIKKAMKSDCRDACCKETAATKPMRRWTKAEGRKTAVGDNSSVNGTVVRESSRESGRMLALQTIEPKGVNAVDVKGEWEEIKMAVDSGATETVMGEDMLTCTETKIGAAAKRGVEYEVANGVTIPNLGEKTFSFQTAEGAERKITAQICDVNKGLLSVVKMVNAGNTVVFTKDGSFIEDDVTGERIAINEENGMYVLSMWVKKSPF